MSRKRVAIDPVLSVAHAYQEGQDLTLCLVPLATMEVGELVAGSMRTVSLCSDCRFVEAS